MNCYYNKYPGDYQRDTAHLSLMEHGAYNLLMDHYYSTGKPLPNNNTALYRICRAFEPAEQTAIDNVASQFFQPDDNFLRHKRIDRQLSERREFLDAQRESGKKGAEARWGNHGDPNRVSIADPISDPIDSANGDGNGEQHGELMASNSNSKSNSKSTANKAEHGARFARFWSVYPRKTDKGKAEKAFAKLKPDEALLETMLTALAQQGQSRQWREGVIPHAATWLNGKRWTDELLPDSCGKRGESEWERKTREARESGDRWVTEGEAHHA